jgi:hypothetical protein
MNRDDKIFIYIRQVLMVLHRDTNHTGAISNFNDTILYPRICFLTIFIAYVASIRNFGLQCQECALSHFHGSILSECYVDSSFDYFNLSEINLY